MCRHLAVIRTPYILHLQSIFTISFGQSTLCQSLFFFAKGFFCKVTELSNGSPNSSPSPLTPRLQPPPLLGHTTYFNSRSIYCIGQDEKTLLCVCNRHLGHCWWDHKLIGILWKKIWENVLIITLFLHVDPVIPLLGIYPK